MKRLLSSVIILLLAAATVPDASAQNRSQSVLEQVFSSVVGDDEGRKPTVILGDDERRTDRKRGRTSRDGEARERRRGGEGGRGTVSGRGGRNGEVDRRDGERGRTQRGVPTGDSRRDDDRDRNDDWEYDERGEDQRAKRGNGPPFCRSGEGHPVFGRSWCRDKGFGVGNQDYDGRYGNDRRADDGIYGPRRQNDDGGLLEDIFGRLAN